MAQIKAQTKIPAIARAVRAPAAVWPLRVFITTLSVILVWLVARQPRTVFTVVEVPLMIGETHLSPPKKNELLFAFAIAEQSYVQLDVANDDDIEQTLTNGRVHRVSELEGYSSTAYVELKQDEVPAHLTSWLGHQVVVDEKCTATITSIQIVSRMVGDIGQASNPGETEAERAKDAFDAGAKVYAGKLSGCPGTYHYGRATNSPKQKFAQKLTLGAAAAPAIRAAKLHLRTTARVMGIQERWKSIEGNDGHWLSQATIEPTAFANDDRAFIVLSIEAGEYCSNFGAQLWVVYEVTHYGGDEDPHVTLGRFVSANQGTIEPVAAIDATGDGQLNLIATADAERTLFSLDGSIRAFEPIEFYGCRC